MQFDVFSSVVLDGGDDEGEVLFDIRKVGLGEATATARVSGPAEVEVEAKPPPSFDEAIADHHSQMVVNARHLTGDVSRADDVVQESMVRAMRGWEHFLEIYEERKAVALAEYGAAQDFDDAVAAWLHRIVTNAFINLYHRGKRDTRRVTQWAVAQRTCGETFVDPRDNLDSPVGDEVARAMAHLNGDQRKVIEMHYLQGMDCTEIANELGLCKKTVFTRLARGRKTLEPLLRRYARSQYGLGLEEGEDDVDVVLDESDEDAA